MSVVDEDLSIKFSDFIVFEYCGVYTFSTPINDKLSWVPADCLVTAPIKIDKDDGWKTDPKITNDDKRNIQECQIEPVFSELLGEETLQL